MTTPKAWTWRRRCIHKLCWRPNTPRNRSRIRSVSRRASELQPSSASRTPNGRRRSRLPTISRIRSGASKDSTGSPGYRPESILLGCPINPPLLCALIHQPVPRAGRERVSPPCAVRGGYHDDPAVILGGELLNVGGRAVAGEDPDELCVDLLGALGPKRGVDKRKFAARKARPPVAQQRP